MRARHVLTLLVGLACLAPAAQAKMYKWVDENGNVTYSEHKPPDRDAEQVKLLGVPKVTNEEARQRLDQLEEKAGTQRKDREFAQSASSDEAAREQRLKENCETARQNMRVLKNASRIKADDGSYLDDSQREVRVAATQRQIDDNCGN